MEVRIPTLSALDKKTVLVLGTGRSGTTWLAGLLAAPFRYRLLFEPFHPEHVEGAERVADHYYPAEAIPSDVRSLCQAALGDRIDSDWIAQDSNRRFGMHRWRFWPKARICKSIRTNLLIPAYRSIFGEDLSIVVVIRRPQDVVESLMRVGFSWATEIETLLDQKPVVDRWQLPTAELRKLSRSPAAALATRWLIENIGLLRADPMPGVHTLRYERLRESPVEVVRDLCARVGLEPAQDLDERAPRRSHTTHPRSPSFSDAPGVLEETDLDLIRRVLELGDLESELD